MKYLTVTAAVLFLFIACSEPPKLDSVDPENWASRAALISETDSLEYGKSYLSVYSQIYSYTQHQKYELTAMISLRNVSDTDTVYLLSAEYFDSHGKSVRNYFSSPIYLAPLETTEIIIDQKDVSGGTGANFIIEWKIPAEGCPPPLFEGVMSSMQSSQGISFVTHGVRVE